MPSLSSVLERAQLLGSLAAAAVDRDRPLMANLIVTRRCNLSCGYCNEYDKVSPPVPLDTLKERIDHLARLRTVIVTLTGGEPLLHPQLDEVIRHVRARGMTPAMNSNAFLLSEPIIHRLNAAGLFALQVSVDGVTPNQITKKTLKPLLPKLRLLAAHAAFRVRINCVFGAAPPEEALEVARTAIALGFDAKCALARNPDGTMAPLDARARAVYDQIANLEGRSLGLLGEDFQDKLLRDGAVAWKCRAGARFFHVCEDGLVHLCGPRFGASPTPLATYTVDDIRRAFDTKKACASTCPVAYAHMASKVDRFRAQSDVLDPATAPPPVTREAGRVRLRVAA
ncbi:MAG: radical SAM protein [Deltaproteobacteria bacterium]|nr:radical SAM protein [Kofleriaceae bacterium]